MRPSPIAGTWYPGDPFDLRQIVEGFLEKATAPDVRGQVTGLIVPHAGLIYSGLSAAHAFKTLIDRSYQRVILLSPSHNPYEPRLLTTAHEAYATPLGEVPVDHGSLVSLAGELDEEGVSFRALRADREHSLEIELPFLQVTQPGGFTLVPLMLRDQTRHVARVLSESLCVLLKSYPVEEKTLLVASSDLSHFYTESEAGRLDHRVIDALETMDVNRLYELNQTGKGQACGLGAIATVLLTLQKISPQSLTIADYRTSAAVTQDRSSVVGYTSAVITSEP